MTRTPDETKKGLECRIRSIRYACNRQCDTCDLRIPAYTILERFEDALALIQQLQAENAEQAERIQQLEAERDAAVKELKMIGKCVCCKHDKLCTFIFPNCVECEKTDCPCHTCEYRSNWEWRGVPKEE